MLKRGKYMCYDGTGSETEKIRRCGMKNINTESVLRALSVDVIGSLLIGISVVVFAVGADFAPGGITGIAVLLNYLLHVPVGAATILLNIPIILGSFRLLGKDFFFASVKTMVISSLFIDYVVCYLDPFTGNRFLASVLAGIVGGAGYALIYMQDSSTGGTDFIIMSVKKLKPGFSVGQITQLLDGSIIFLAAFVYKEVGVIFYGLVYTAVISATIDFVIKIFSDCRMPRPLKQFFVIKAL